MSFAPRKDGASRLDLLPRQVYWIAQNAPSALWPTPTSLAPARNGNNEAGNSAGLVAIRAHALHLWNTPVADDTGLRRKNYPQGGKALSTMAGEATGVLPESSSATTEKPGALAPGFVSWLMGFPPEWLYCAPDAMPKKPRKSK